MLLATLVAASAETRKITYRTLCLAWAGDVRTLHLLPPGGTGGSREIPLFTEIFSLPEEAEVDPSGVRFSVDAAGTRLLPPVKLPDSGRVLFLFVPSPGSKDGPYRIAAFAEDDDSFPPGSVRLLNLSPVPVRFELGEHEGEKGGLVAPGKTGLIRSIRKVNHLNAYDAKVTRRDPDGKFVLFYNSRWRSVATKRDLAIACPDPRTGQPAVLLFEDAPPAEIPAP